MDHFVKCVPMNDREKSIALAAIRTYQAKGVRRTTMSDIAKAAGVTRQTVYNCNELSLGATSQVNSKVTAQTMTSVKGGKLVGEVQITGG